MVSGRSGVAARQRSVASLTGLPPLLPLLSFPVGPGDGASAMLIVMRATRRQFLFAAAATAVLAPALAWYAHPAAVEERGRFPFALTEDEWKRSLSPEAYRVLRGRATERPFSSPLDRETGRGTFVCAGCAHPLFSSDAKYDSGTGWPSFWQPLPGAIVTIVDTSWFMVRSEVRCARCGSHIGHVFADGPKPTGLRYCMNGVALRFVQSA